MRGIPLRCAVLLASAGLFGALAGTPAATADDFSRVDRDPAVGADLVLDDGRSAPTALFSLRVGERDSVRAYATRVDEEVRPRTAYVESDWSDREGWEQVPEATDPADRASWIVAHSYPGVALTSLALDADELHVDEAQAIAGTQAALWHVLDGTELDRDANDSAVVAVHDLLVRGSARAVDTAAELSLEVAPTQLEAVDPEAPLGPLTVGSAGSGSLRLSVHGAPASWLVDGDGQQVSRAGDGDRLYLDVDPAVRAGVATVHVHGSDLPLPEGRLFAGRDGASTQPLVTAEPGTMSSSATATLTWRGSTTPEPGPGADDAAESEAPDVEEEAPAAEAPAAESARVEQPEPPESPSATDDRIADDDLAITGTWLSALLVIAGALVVSGLLILVLGRRRRD
ncbi:thioester domain-containing protein [Nocardiopsis sp. NRRL B-16309]|uniref:thioester domain-containing protein n=1 Tax=Nocardiopsis sp. NRRL B-16309 TaxID=1519494 RepID=UPI0006B0292B|nr:thioester domain-containing protein [Nocardiopsis sp. NRRL B-16309]KOX18264.1 peptidase [Nocardiopsis sp. NRRL B-16309]